MRPSQLIFENRPDEAIVEETRGSVDDVKRLGLGIVRPHAASWAEHRTVRQG
jgi:hypothetical protein